MMNQIELGDCRELILRVPDDSIDMIFTDPPYDKASLWAYGWLAREAARVLKPGGFCVVYSGGLYLDKVMLDMLEHLEYFYCCMTYEPAANVKVYHRNVIQMHKPILVFNKPPAKKPYHMVASVFQTRNDKRWHKWGQSVSCAGYFIHCFSKLGDIVLDPFSGGGTTTLACSLEGRSSLAFEIDENWYTGSVDRLSVIQSIMFTRDEEVNQAYLIDEN